MIISTNVLNLSEQSPGRYRCVFNYIFDDGREVNIKPSSVGADYQVVAESRIPNIERNMELADAEEAVSLEIDTPYKYASQNDVLYAFLVSGYEDADPINSYLKMMKPVAKVQSAGITLQQLANYSGEPISYFQAMWAKWQVLDANKIMMQEYKTLRDSL